MHDAAFAHAALPRPARILGLSMRRFAIGHQLWLDAEENPLGRTYSAEPVCGHHVTEAAWICAHTWTELQCQPSQWTTLPRIWLWDRLNRHQDLALAAADFQNYRRAGSTLPQVKDSPHTGRDHGAPSLASLLQFVIARLEYPGSAYDYPLGLAYWHFATEKEQDGAILIPNEGEIDFEDWCQEQDRAAERRT
jgi:hypothetical protein